MVHQLQAPRLEIHSDGATRTAHLSYHGEAHYNSVRAVDDFGTDGDPPKPIGQLQPRPPPAATNDKEAKEEKKRRKQVAQSVPWASEAEVEKVRGGEWSGGGRVDRGKLFTPSASLWCTAVGLNCVGALGVTRLSRRLEVTCTPLSKPS